jgi:hypothetical protein
MVLHHQGKSLRMRGFLLSKINQGITNNKIGELLGEL